MKRLRWVQALPLALCLVFSFSHVRLYAQNEVDAVRYSQPGLGVGARALGMGSAYTGVANDYSAIVFNPAGLAQIRRMEFNAGFNYNSYNSNASYLSTAQQDNITQTGFQNIGFVFPFPTYQGSFVIAGGYNRQANFGAIQNVNAFNPTQSIADSWVRSPSDVSDLAFGVGLLDTARGGAFIRSQDPRDLTGANVRQRSRTLEDGGRSNYSLAMAVELAPAIYFGATLNISSGSYSFSRSFREDDVNNVYSRWNNLELTDNITTSFSGWNTKLGVLYTASNNLRLGLTVETPTFLSLTDRFTTRLTSAFSSPPFPNDPPFATRVNFSDEYPEETFSYRLRTPFVFGAGVSFEESFLTLSGQVNFTDWTQLRYSTDDGGNTFDEQNQLFRTEFRQSLDFALGGEARLATLPVRLRGGYNVQYSPYKFRDNAGTIPTNWDDARKTWSVGVGLLLRQTLTIDVAYLQTNQLIQGSLYAGSLPVSEQLSVNNIVVTTSFRF
jgi:long-subunit fatty acid transport protein